MSFNSFGRILRYTSWGESHGLSIGCVIDGVPPLIAISKEEIQQDIERRRSALSRHTSQRKERDRVEILSGVFEGKTTGTPIALEIINEDARSKDYANIAKVYRPGHADYVTERKYGIRDWRGGGRASARETVMRVAAGAIARKILGEKVVIRAALSQIGKIKVDEKRWSWEDCHVDNLFCPDKETLTLWQKNLDEARRKGVSLGGRIKAQACGIPVGWGAPLYGKLDADLAAAMMGINAVKAIEIGAGFDVVERDGLENADEMLEGSGGEKKYSSEPQFVTNNAGGIIGGISTGQDISFSLAVKPTSSIRKSLRTIDVDGKASTVETLGRHDPCVAIRAVPIVEAMLALVLADHKLLHRAQCG